MTLTPEHALLLDPLRINLARIKRVRETVLTLYLAPVQAEINALCDNYGLQFDCHPTDRMAFLRQNAVHNKEVISPSLFHALDGSLYAFVYSRLDNTEKVYDHLDEYKPDSYEITSQFVLTKDGAYVLPSNTPCETADSTAMIYKDISPALAKFLLEYTFNHDFEETRKLFPRPL
jgi:hypothetical protein